MKTPITIMLADDHHVVREGLKLLLESERDLRVVGEAASGPEVAEKLDALKPAVLVLDVMMPGLSGLEVIRHASKRSPATRIVMLSMHANEAYVVEALRAGALAYVLKTAATTDLVRAVRGAAAGRRYLSPPLSEAALEVYLRRTREAEAGAREGLTPRERMVLQLSAEGLTSKGVAERLGISPRTAETHRARGMRKLGLSRRAHLVRYLLQHGLLPEEPSAEAPPRAVRTHSRGKRTAPRQT